MYETKYKALRKAFILWRTIERQKEKNLKKNIQRLQSYCFDLQRGNQAAYWKLWNLLFEMKKGID